MPEKLHDAFISYSRKDRVFASLLEEALEAFSPPEIGTIPQKHLNIFRDEEDFTGTDYHKAVSKHLRDSRKLIVICTPAARASQYVNDEIRVFAETNGSDNIIPILLDGIPNNEAFSDHQAEKAFPDTLVEIIQMPLAISYRDFQPEKDKVSKGKFDSAWFSLLANLYDIGRNEIEQRERKRQIRLRNYWLGGLGSVAIALLALSIWALIEKNTANIQRDEALRSQSVFLAQESRQQTESGKPDLGIKLALYALPRRLDQPDRPWIWSAEAALYKAIAQQKFKLTLGGIRAGFGENLKRARVSPDGTRAVLDYGLQAELWDLESGEMIQTFKADNDHSWISQIAFSPDGRILTIAYTTSGQMVYGGYGSLYGDQSGMTVRGSLIQVIGAHAGSMVHQFQVAGHDQNYLQFSPSGKILLIATNEMLILVETSQWNATKEYIKWQGSEDITALVPPYSHMVFNEDESKFAISTEKGVIGFFDRITKLSGTIRNFENDIISGLQFLPNENSLMAIAIGSDVAVIDINQTESSTDISRKSHLPRKDTDKILTLGYRKDISAIVAVTENANVLSWPLGEEQVDFSVDQLPKDLLRKSYLSADGKAAIVEFEDSRVEYWNIPNKTRKSIPSNNAATHLIEANFDQKGSVALLVNSDSYVHFLDLVAQDSVEQFQLDTNGRKATRAIFRPKTHQVAVGYDNGSVEVVDIFQNKTIWQSEITHKGPITYLAFDSSGARLISTSKDKTGFIWNMANREQPLQLIGHGESVDFAAFNPNGDLIVTGSSDSTFRLWDASTGKERNVLSIPSEYLDPIHNASINAQAKFTSDGKLLITVTSGDGYVIEQPAFVWEVQSGRILQAFRHEGGSIWDIDITPDDNYAVTASYDNSSALWDIHSGKRIQTFHGHSTRVLKAIINKNGRLLATASGDGALLIWQTDTGRKIHEKQLNSGLVNLELSHNGRFIASGSGTDDKAVIEI